MHTIISARLYIDNPTAELIKWCGDNLVVSNPEYAKKLRMGLWVGRTPEKLYLYEQHGDRLILPYGVLADIWSMVSAGAIHVDLAPSVGVEYLSKIQLYPYQNDAVTAVLDHSYGILQAPAGSGKTQMALEIVARHGKRALWITHTHDLLQQSIERAAQYLDPSTFGTITEGRVDIGTGITFATVQTLGQLDLTELKDRWSVIIVDECHRVAGSPTSITRFYKVLNALAAPYKYGLSATVHRADGMVRATKALLGDVVYTVPQDAVAKTVMPVRICPVATDAILTRDSLNTDGTLNYTALITSLAGDAERNALIADYIVGACPRLHSCLVLVDRLAQIEAILNLLPPEVREMAVTVTGKMTSQSAKAARGEAIELMRRGQKHILFATYALAKEGLDIPRLDRLFLASPQKDFAIITQSIGRIARTHPDKQDAICFDFVDEDIRFLLNRYRARKRIYAKNNCIIK